MSTVFFFRADFATVSAEFFVSKFVSHFFQDSATTLFLAHTQKHAIGRFLVLE